MDAKDRKLISNNLYNGTDSQYSGWKHIWSEECILYTEDIFEDSEELNGVVIVGLNIARLRFADDTLLMAESMEEMQKIVDAVREASQEQGWRRSIEEDKQ